MSSRKLTIALIFGGRSAEHEVSLRSARSIFDAIDHTKYEVIPILITHEGRWRRMPADLSAFQDTTRPSETDRLIFSPDPQHGGFLTVDHKGNLSPLSTDVVFPALHGAYGEDGALQGLLELADKPYVGCGVLASAVGMDKVLMKAAFKDSGLEVGPFFSFLISEWRQESDKIIRRLNKSILPVFVKPANLGSSVGISRVTNLSDFEKAVELAGKYDRKILVEDAIVGRELEVSVLGNDQPVASIPGEVIPQAEFYDYEEKYLRDSAKIVIPADLPSDIIEKARYVAITAFKSVDGTGLGRVDMFYTSNGSIVVNEINTLPGFTSISMYPKLWEATGLSYVALIDRLIELALDRHRERQNILTCRNPS